MLSQVSLCPRGRGWVGISGLMSFPGMGISGTRSLPGVGMFGGGGIHTSGLGWNFRIMVTPPLPTWDLGDTTGYIWKTGGTHPTGMLSCWPTIFTILIA